MKLITVPMNGESGCYVGPLGKLQTRRIKACLKENFKDATITFKPNHYCCTAFLRFKEKVIYLSVSDYRYFPGSFVVREAKHEKDYTGGVNHYFLGLERIPEAIKSLL